jgi:HAE1 family hydrophobic/amphiphilic exporter-1
MRSTNANDGTFNLQVTFDVDSDINIDQVNTQNKAAQAQALLPPDVNNFGLTFLQSTGLPLGGDLHLLPGEQLRHALPEQLRDPSM